MIPHCVRIAWNSKSLNQDFHLPMYICYTAMCLCLQTRCLNYASNTSLLRPVTQHSCNQSQPPHMLYIDQQPAATAWQQKLAQREVCWRIFLWLFPSHPPYIRHFTRVVTLACYISTKCFAPWGPVTFSLLPHKGVFTSYHCSMFMYQFQYGCSS